MLRSNELVGVTARRLSAEDRIQRQSELRFAVVDEDEDALRITPRS
jgi:hypothetical protein